MPDAALLAGNSPVPMVSIITPTYNRPDLLREAIGSVLNQSFDDWEMLIVDDGSEPGAHPVVDGFADPRLR
ncbi:MAG TPA: glycosyltransferase, partial [Promineifilum sp.]|nr:glycosyltransferase [Promineifilum sp.]